MSFEIRRACYPADAEQMMRNLAPVFRIGLCTAILAVVSGCMTDDYSLKVELETGPSLSASAWRVGDTARVVATEWVQRPFETFEPSLPSSKNAPDEYGWASSDTTIMKIVSGGVLFMKAPGTAGLTVRSPRAKSTIPLTVHP